MGKILGNFFLIIAVFLILSSSVAIIFQFRKIAENSANYAYFFLLLGVLTQFWLFLKEDKNED